jgi:hypothetical protein
MTNDEEEEEAEHKRSARRRRPTPMVLVQHRKSPDGPELINIAFFQILHVLVKMKATIHGFKVGGSAKKSGARWSL